MASNSSCNGDAEKIGSYIQALVALIQKRDRVALSDTEEAYAAGQLDALWQRLSAEQQDALELILAKSDNPELDATAGAHPAWWRGHDAGARGVARMIYELATQSSAKPAGVFADATVAQAADAVRRLLEELDARDEDELVVRTEPE